MKKILKNWIKKYLKKHLNAHPKHYYFLRWLADIVKDEKQMDEIYWFFAKWVYDTDAAYLLDKFNDLFVVDNNVYIVTFRPGLWIGKRGQTVESLKHSLNYNIDEEKINDYDIQFIEVHKQPYSEVLSYAHMYANNW